MAKYTKTLELLNRLLDEKDITIPCNSEKTAVAEFNKMIKVLKELFDPINYGWLKYCIGQGMNSWEEIYPNDEGWHTQRFGPLNELFPFIEKVKSIIGSNYKTAKTTIDTAEYIKGFTGRDCQPGFEIKFKSGFRISWVQKNTTKTSKRLASEELNDELFKKVSEAIGCYGYVPNGCYPYRSNYKKVTEDVFELCLGRCYAYINGEITPEPSTPKQAMWVSKMLGVPESIAQKFNKFQASEILDTLFNSNKIYSEEEIKKVKEFYLNKAREFGYQANNNVNENKKMKRTARINENRLKKIVAESLRTILREMANEANKLPIRLVGGDLQGEYDLGSFEREHSDLIKGRITPEQYPHLRPDLHGYPKIAGYLGPMYDGDAVRYETQEVYDILST